MAELSRTITELRAAVEGFVNRYNVQWRIENNVFLSPHQASSARQSLSHAETFAPDGNQDALTAQNGSSRDSSEAV